MGRPGKHAVGLAVGGAVLALGMTMAGAAGAGPSLNPGAVPDTNLGAGTAREAGLKRIQSALDGVIKVKVRAVPNARSQGTLGTERVGSGVVVGAGGLVLTIGYLIVEAESVELEDTNGKSVAATLVAYDHNTGFGLVRALTPLAAQPVELGDSGKLTESDNVIFAAAGGIDAASSATVVSRRRFAGYWEYMIDGAIFTSPPRFDHSGAALIDRDGKLIGIGSLIVADTIGKAGTSVRLPGNMFVPVDLLKPILRELVENGSTRKGRHPWLGVTSQEAEGRVFVSRVQADSPAERAGLRAGDILLGVGDAKVGRLEEFYDALWRDAGPGDEVALTVLQGAEVRKILVKSMDRVDYMRKKTAI